MTHSPGIPEDTPSGEEFHESGNLDLPREFPPVQPPSAGMIVQLFLIPAVIVAVIIGVYALFGRMASQELDWRQLTVDVRSENPHVRWRGALGLAQMLDADAQRGSQSQNLAAQPEIATALAELYEELITRNSPNEEELKQIEFLSKALGRMQVPNVVLPVLQSGMLTERGLDVRKHSLIGLSMLAGTMQESGHPLKDAALVDELIQISRETQPLFRQQSAYALGLLPSSAGLQRLEIMLGDPDQMVRVNAAIGLARNDSTLGLPVFEELLTESAGWKLDPATVKTAEQEARYFERMLMVLNVMKAVGQLQSQFTPEQREEFVKLVQAVTDSTQDAVLRTEALELLHELTGKSSSA